jgi:hypothetical protein
VSSRRESLLEHIVSLAGPHAATVIDPQNGWPGLVNVQLSDGPQLVAMHVGPEGLSHRGRDDVERRFQNPGQGKPVTAPRGALPLLIGLWEQGTSPVLVGMDAAHRLGKETRQSLFISLAALEQAAKEGWAEHHSDTGELIVAFHPALLPTYVELRRRAVPVPPTDILSVLEASGLTDDYSDEAAERARRASSQLIRDAAFRLEVAARYSGLCAMCGLDFGLVEGAHIYPARAPGSQDKIWNGLALCGNHHMAFDKHLIWVEPDSRKIAVHSAVKDTAPQNDACRRFVEVTYQTLQEPTPRSARPLSQMFAKRYEFFAGKYNWAA